MLPYKEFNLNHKVFKSLSNSNNGEVDDSTRFYYRQKDNIVWATYRGGSVKFGTLSGKMVSNRSLVFNYQHENNDGELMTGHCQTEIRLNENGIFLLHEQWQWTCRDHSKGSSVLIEAQGETFAAD